MVTTGEPTYPPTPTPAPGEPMAPEAMPPGAPPTAVPMAAPPKRITSGGIIAIIGGILMALSVLLAWYSISVGPIGFGFNPFQLGDVSAQTGGEFPLGTELMIYAMVALIMGILAIVMVPVRKPAVSGIFGIIGLVVMIVALLRTNTWSINITDPFSGMSLSAGPGIGIYVGLVGAILAMIGGFVGHKQM